MFQIVPRAFHMPDLYLRRQTPERLTDWSRVTDAGDLKFDRWRAEIGRGPGVGGNRWHSAVGEGVKDLRTAPWPGRVKSHSGPARPTDGPTNQQTH
jgi:hypothetical protein